MTNGYPYKKECTTTSQWLEERCRAERLSNRQAGIKAGLSYTAIANIRKGDRPSPGTVIKLAQAFGGSGSNQRLALEDYLLVLAGYRTPRPHEEFSEPLAQLMDRVEKFSVPQLEMMVSFAEFLVEIGKLTKSTN